MKKIVITIREHSLVALFCHWGGEYVEIRKVKKKQMKIRRAKEQSIKVKTESIKLAGHKVQSTPLVRLTVGRKYWMQL